MPKVKGIYMKPLLWLCLEGSSTCSARSLSEHSASCWLQPPEGHVPQRCWYLPDLTKVCFLAVIHSYLGCLCLASTGALLPRALWPQRPPPPGLHHFFPLEGTGRRAQGFPTLSASCSHLHTVERQSASLDPAENKGLLLCSSAPPSVSPCSTESWCPGPLWEALPAVASPGCGELEKNSPCALVYALQTAFSFSIALALPAVLSHVV